MTGVRLVGNSDFGEGTGTAHVYAHDPAGRRIVVGEQSGKVTTN